MARPRSEELTLKLPRRAKHVAFHLGVQVRGKVYMTLSLANKEHVGKGLEMWALPNALFVKINGEEVIIPYSVTHSVILEDNKNEPEVNA